MARTPIPDAREHILATAGRLFAEHGVRAVGLQQVVDACGCGKSRLYRRFASKDDLVVAWLEEARADWRALLQRAVTDVDDPADQLVAIVREVAADAAAPGHRGSPLHNTAAEFPDPDHPVRRVAVEHVRTVRRQLRAIAQQTGAAEPAALADQLLLVVDGLYADTQLLGRTGASRTAVTLAETVVATATR